ncbi:MAG TPA: hypothetical protein VJ521_14320, partial [Acidobacteriota bacterium]|nr:hypothetical protein [Acidobacteriota bacterium]
PAYVNVCASINVRNATACLEDWWKEFQPYADHNFCTEIKTDFFQRCWELYLGITLLRRNFILTAHGERFPDFDVKHPLTGDRLTWIEAVAVKKGTTVDKVPDMILGEAADVPEEQMLLRLATALDGKQEQYHSRLERGVCSPDEAYVIAVNSAELGHPDAEMPLILKALFGIGHLTLELSVSDAPTEIVDSFWSPRPTVSKQNNEPVGMGFFRDPSNAGISAIFYCTSHIFNSPHLPEEMGENIVVVHNPLAINALPEGAFPFGAEYRAIENGVEKIRERNEYRSMYGDLIRYPYVLPGRREKRDSVT